MDVYSACPVHEYLRLPEGSGDVACTMKSLSDEHNWLDCGMSCETDLRHCCHAFGVHEDQCAICSKWDNDGCHARHVEQPGPPPFELLLHTGE